MQEGGISDDPIDAIVAAWRRELPDLPTHSIGIVTRVWHIAKILGDDRARLLRDHHADTATLDLLSTLRRQGAPYRMTTRELAAASLITAGAITQRVDRAEAQGLVTRSTRPNSRTVDIALSPLGRTTIDSLVTAVLTRECELLADLPVQRHDQLENMLRELLAHLTRMLDVSRRPSHVGHRDDADDA